MYLAYIFFLFATVSAIPTGRVEIVFPSVETSRSGMKTVKFRALGEDVELKLEPAGDILAQDFALYNGNQEKQQSVNVESLRRRLYRDSANGAALLIDDDEQPPSIEGIVFSKLRISPHEWKEVTEEGKRAHQVEELTSDRDSYLSDDILIPDFQREMVSFTRIDRNDKCIVIEVLLVTDRKFTERCETNEALTEYVTLLSSVTEALFRQLDSGWQLRLLGIMTFTNETEPPLFEESKHPNGAYKPVFVNKINDYFRENPTSLSKNADIIGILLTRSMRDRMDDWYSFEGLAFGNSVCSGNKACAINAYEKAEQAAYNLAHEMAHSLGIFHDGEFYRCVPEEVSEVISCPNSNYIMGYNSGDNYGKIFRMF
uniref:Metalloproteinase n=1 Tax=Tityus obscurus TaxID=1221240 RepID=VMP_TITOB|nr:RecName: Full=Metalloproteinase; Flags: Precursor [Tityus obscurus]